MAAGRRLGQLDIDEKLRPWLIGKGILSERVKAVCGERFSLRLVDQWSSLLSNSHKLALRTRDNAGMFRNVELCSAAKQAPITRLRRAGSICWPRVKMRMMPMPTCAPS